MIRALTAFVLTCVCITGGHAHSKEVGIGALEQVRDQGILYLKRKLPKLAMSHLDRVYRSERGKRDFRTVFYRARAALELGQLGIADSMMNEAKALTKSQRQLNRIQALQAEFRSSFGSVRVLPAIGEARRQGRLILERESTLINKRKRDSYLSLQTRLGSAPATLPMMLYVPHGRYRLNGVDFEVSEAKHSTTVKVFLRQFVGGQGGQSRMWWWIGSGVVAATVVGVAAVMLFDEPEPKYRDALRIQLD